MLEILAPLVPILLLCLITALLTLLLVAINRQSSSTPSKIRQQRIPITHPKRNNWDDRSSKPKVRQYGSTPLPKHNAQLRYTQSNKHRQQGRNTASQGKRTLHDNHPLRIKLLSMVGGDVGTADRLLNQIARDNPGMPVEWYFDKAIQDLIRDRR